jgi:hypothetical protein
MGSRVSHTSAAAGALLLGTALLAYGAVSAGGQIVYTHNDSIRTMNDDGSGPHALVPSAACEQRATPGVGSTSAVAGCTIQNATRLTTGDENEGAVVVTATAWSWWMPCRAYDGIVVVYGMTA